MKYRLFMNSETMTAICVHERQNHDTMFYAAVLCIVNLTSTMGENNQHLWRTSKVETVYSWAWEESGLKILTKP